MGFASMDALWTSREAGALWENHIISQWLRWRDWHEPSLGLWYWRDQGGNEVDLILERDRRLVAVECKLKERPQEKDIRGIRKLRKFYGSDEVAKAYVAIPADVSFDLEPEITAISGWEVWPLSSKEVHKDTT